MITRLIGRAEMRRRRPYRRPQLVTTNELPSSCTSASPAPPRFFICPAHCTRRVGTGVYLHPPLHPVRGRRRSRVHRAGETCVHTPPSNKSRRAGAGEEALNGRGPRASSFFVTSAAPRGTGPAVRRARRRDARGTGATPTCVAGLARLSRRDSLYCVPERRLRSSCCTGRPSSSPAWLAVTMPLCAAARASLRISASIGPSPERRRD